MTDDDLARHAAKAAKRKAFRDAKIATKTIEKGLLMVHTGKGRSEEHTSELQSH